MNNPQRLQNTIDDLSLEIPRRLPPDLRQVFLTNYPDGKYGQLFEANYLACWHEFARRMEAGGFFKLHQRNAAVRPAPGSGSYLEQMERNRQRHLLAFRERLEREIDREMQNNPIERLRKAALQILESCDQIAAEGRVH